MATVLEECNTQEQRSVVCTLWAKGLNAMDIHKEIFPVYSGKCLSRKTLTTGRQIFAYDEEVETDVQQWVEQQSKDVYASGFDALVR
jgi:hypothetical protein